MNYSKALIGSLLLAGIATSALATGPNNGQAVTDGLYLIANGGEVSAQIVQFGFNGGPGYKNGISLSNTGALVGYNYDWQQNTTAVNLGSFTSGEELKFALKTNLWGNANGENTFFTGPGSRNIDGNVHAYVTTLSNNSVRVDFEDLVGGDWNYGDASMIVTGVHSSPSVAATPEPVSMSLLGLGGIAALRRRNKKA